MQEERDVKLKTVLSMLTMEDIVLNMKIVKNVKPKTALSMLSMEDIVFHMEEVRNVKLKTALSMLSMEDIVFHMEEEDVVLQLEEEGFSRPRWDSLLARIHAWWSEAKVWFHQYIEGRWLVERFRGIVASQPSVTRLITSFTLCVVLPSPIGPSSSAARNRFESNMLVFQPILPEHFDENVDLSHLSYSTDMGSYILNP
uniref:Uncharacterized protein n=1 Tax=Timema poppense TaxID=170557 RepID=A0A7R9DCF3_TIMPO|nr:unnamed protein product [Timema poppensis]